MQKETVYKLDSKGKKRVWSIWVEGDPNSLTASASIRIESGLLEGKKVNETLEVTSGKNLDKSNQTTPYTQAMAEARAKLELKLRGEYRPTLEEVSQGTLRSGIQAPMLAQKYHPTGEQKGSKTLDKMKIKGKNIHVQPKLDGNRCLIKLQYTDDDGITAVMYTRKGDVMPVQLSHVLEEAIKAVPEVRSELVLDGELFSDELSFNELNGHLKRKDSQDLEQLAKIKYHIYDVMLPAHGYDKRHEFLKSRFVTQENIVIIPNYEITATDENIKAKLEEFLGQGHEGLMIRTLDKGYENKRSWQLVKVKLFEDEEFEVVDLLPDSMGRLGRFLMKLNEPVVDREGNTLTTFKAGLGGIKHSEGKEMLANKEQYIGKKATIEFFGRDPRPRFPKFKGIREDI